MATSNTDIQIRIDTALNSAQAATSLRDMRTSMRELQGLALEVGNSNTEAFNRITTAIGESRDRMNDLNDSIQATSGDPLEKVGNSVGLISSSLSSLDFGGATIGIKSLRENLSNLNFGELSSGLKEFGAEFMKLGATILFNPIFLLGAAILLIITNFEKLKNAGGLIGDMFTKIGNIISNVIKFFTDLTDAIGLTNTKLAEQKQLTADLADLNYKWRDAVISVEEAQLALQNKSVVGKEFEKLKNSADQALIAIEQLNKAFVGYTALPTAEAAFKQATKDFDELQKIYPTLTKDMLAKVKDLYNNYYIARLNQDNFYQTESYKRENEAKERIFGLEQKRINAMTNIRQREIAQIKLDKDKQLYEQIRANRLSVSDNEETFKKGLDAAKAYRKELTGEKASIELIDVNSGKKRILSYIEAKKELNKMLMEEEKKTDLSLTDKQKNIDYLKTKIGEIDVLINKNTNDINETDKKIKYLEGKTTAIIEANKSAVNAMAYIEQEARNKAIDATLKYEESKLDIQKRFNDARLEADLANLEINYNKLSVKEKATTEKYETDKKTILLNSIESEIATTDKAYDIKIQQAERLGQSTVALEEEQTAAIAKLVAKRESIIKTADENIAKAREKASADKEKAFKDDIQLTEKSIQAYITTFNSRKSINEMEQAMMKQGEERYSFNLGERLRLLKENLKNENEILNGEERKALLDNMLNNTTNAEQRDLEIRQEYAAKRAKLEKDSQAARISAATEEADKIYSATKKGLEMWSAINTYYDTVDENRQDQTEEQAEQRAKAKFERNKELQLANAIVNTAAATIFPLIEGDYAGAIFAAALGAVQIATIMATQYKSTGTTTTNPVIAPEAAKPTSAAGGFMGQGFTNQQFNPNDFMNSQYRFQTGNQKVYVLESDITNMVNRVAVAQDRNTLRGW